MSDIEIGPDGAPVVVPPGVARQRVTDAVMARLIDAMRADLVIPDLGEVVEAWVDPDTNTLHVTRTIPGYARVIEIDIHWSHDP